MKSGQKKEYIPITENFKQILNFNFSTDMLFRYTKKNYADEFKKGKLRFNQPKNWIVEGNKGNIGLGDSLEGIFLTTDMNDDSGFINGLKSNNKLECFNINFKTYFRRKEIKDLYCFCLYGLNSNSFKEKSIDRFGETHYVSRIKKNYFNDFSNGITKQTYNRNDEDRNVVIFINNPHLFFEKIRNFFINLGINKNDIIISPIEYIDLKSNSISLVPYPNELLLKDNYYCNQSEIRIIINSKSKKLKKYMNDNNNIINIGNINNITDVYDFYFDDMLLEKQGNTLLFTLPFPSKIDLRDLTLRKILNIFVQINNDKLPYETTFEERIQLIRAIKIIIKNKYDADISIENKQIVLHGLNKDLNEIIDT